MKSNPLDNVYQGILDRFAGVKDQLGKEFKGTQPFNSTPIQPVDAIAAFDSLTTDQKKQLVMKHGEMAFLEYKADMLDLKRKREAHGGKI
jgi:hypothetical protein